MSNSKVNVANTLGGIFTGKAVRTKGEHVSVNTEIVNSQQIRELSELSGSTEVCIKRSGTGLVVIARSQTF